MKLEYSRPEGRPHVWELCLVHHDTKTVESYERMQVGTMLQQRVVNQWNIHLKLCGAMCSTLSGARLTGLVNWLFNDNVSTRK